MHWSAPCGLYRIKTPLGVIVSYCPDTKEPKLAAAKITSSEIRDLNEWRQTVASRLLPLTIDTDDVDGFHATIQGITVNGIRLFNITATRHRLERTRRLAQGNADPFYSISLQLKGTSTIEQNGNTATLQPNDFAVYDSTFPYRRTFPDDSQTLVVMFPQQLINLPPRALAEIAGLGISGQNGLGAIVAHFLVGVADNLEAFQSSLGLSMAHSLVELVSAAFSEKLGVVVPHRSDAHLELTMRIRDYIISQLSDPELGLDQIASAHFISTRHLQVLFREQGTTVSTWMRERRLEMCRRDLADPLGQAESIRAVAERWGFYNPAHFSRIFKDAYAYSPRDYRLNVLHDQDTRLNAVDSGA